MQSVILLIAGFAAVLPLAVGKNDPAGDAAQLREAIRGVNDRISAWFVEYGQVASNGAAPDGAIHRLVAARFPHDLYHWSTKGTSRVKWQDDPLQQRLVIAKDQMFWELPMKRFFNRRSIAGHDELPGSMPNEVLWPVLGWWPFESWPTPKLGGEHPYLLVDVAKSREYQLRQDQALCGGVPCHVLECPGRGTLWFDANRDGCLMAREFYDKESGATIQHLAMSSHKELQPGIWCPMEFQNVVFDYKAPTEERRKRRLVDARFRVLNVKLNEDVPDELFEIPEPKPGSIQFFDDGSFEQAVPGGYDYLDEMAGWIERNVDYKKPVARASVTEVTCHVIAILISVHIIFLCWRFRRGRLSDGQLATDSGGNDPAG